MEEIRIGIASSSELYRGKLEDQRIQIKKHEWELLKAYTDQSGVNQDTTEIELTIREISIEAEVEVREQLQEKGCHFFLEVYQEDDGQFGVVISCVPLRRKRIVRGVDYIDWYRKRLPSAREVLTGMTRLIRRARDRW